MRYLEKETKSIINVHKCPDSWFWDKYSLSAYQGCEFACLYCYAREERFSASFGDADTIFVKRAAAEALDARVSRARSLLPDVVGMSGVCDPYQECEARFGSTRACLEVLEKHKWPVHLITKSPRVLKDLEVFSAIARDTWATISFTITTANPEIARFLEPNAPPPEERFRAISEIKKRDSRIQTGVMAMPLVPGLEDDKADIEALVKRASEAGADYFVFSPGLTLAGKQGSYFLNPLFARNPELTPLYEKLYSFRHSSDEYRGSYGPSLEYIVRIAGIVIDLLARFSIPMRVKRFIPRDFRGPNYAVSELLFARAYEAQMRGRAWNKDFWAAQTIQSLEESIFDIEERGELRKIRNMNPDYEAIVRQAKENFKSA